MAVSIQSPGASVPSIKESKAALRAEMIRKRRSLDPEALESLSGRIERRLLASEEFLAAARVLFFLSLPHEVQTGGMIRRALDLGKKVHVPIVQPGRRLAVCTLPRLDMDFATNGFGIREPAVQDRTIVDPQTLDLVVVPGLAFDPRGGRIGFGGGYYDALFREQAPRAMRVAVAFEFQILESVPQTGDDLPVHRILTENSTINC